jgi:RimJ/RimL family protein N-acetyltransferase
VNHSLTISGYNTRLRPVKLADAEFILHLRTMPHVLGTVGDTLPEITEQRRWIESYLGTPNDYYFIIESMQGQPWGTVGIYNFKETGAEWGRWILMPGILAALPSAVLVHKLAFDVLGLTELRGEVVGDNIKVLSFHRRLGSQQVGIARHSRMIQGKWADLVQFSMTRASWLSVYQKLHPLAEIAGRSLVI